MMELTTTLHFVLSVGALIAMLMSRHLLSDFAVMTVHDHEIKTSTVTIGNLIRMDIRWSVPSNRSDEKNEPAIIATCAHCGDDITEDQKWLPSGRWEYHEGCLEAAEYEASLLRGRPHPIYD